MSLIEAAVKALKSLTTPGMLSLILQTVLITLLCLTGFVIGTSALAVHMSHSAANPWAAESIKWGGSAGSAIIAWLLFPGIMPFIVSFFDAAIAHKIEAHDYQQAQSIKPADFWQELFHDIRFSLKAVFFNIICLPFYLLPLINLFVFYGLNGYLLGREFFAMAARRHMPFAEAEQLRRHHSLTVFSGGVMLAFLATIPFVNLIAPFWGVALAIHLFHQVYVPKTVIQHAQAGQAYVTR